jgi:DNA-binding Lrp family transcriptional regulator
MVRRHAADVRDRIALLGELRATLERLESELGPERAPSLTELCELVRLTAEASAPRHLGEEPAALELLADPIASRILDRLQRRGPATIAAIATALGEARVDVRRRIEQLARHGFVEKDADRTGSWRIVLADLRLPWVDRTPESDAVAHSWFEPSLRALAGFVEGKDEWAASATVSYAMLHLTRAELERLGAEYIALVRRYARPVERAPAGARRTTALMFAFPREDD